MTVLESKTGEIDAEADSEAEAEADVDATADSATELRSPVASSSAGAFDRGNRTTNSLPAPGPSLWAETVPP